MASFLLLIEQLDATHVLFATIAVGALVTLAEWIHRMRIRRLSQLAFGPQGRPRAWTHLAPVARVAGMCLLTWGLLTLLRIEPKVYNEGQIAENEYKHLVLVLDVSPSMSLVDAGEDQKATRRNRASEILDSMFSRIPLRQYLISVIAVYSDAKPVLEDSKDVEVVRYILEELPMYHAFKPGKTNLFEGLSAAGQLAKAWNPNSAVVVVLTDGDTVPATGMPKMPVSISKVLVVGVGDTSVGAFIDGHQSRQDISTLRQVANRLHGIYHNGNQKQLSSQTINDLIQSASKDDALQLTVREWALLATLFGSSLLVGIHVLLPLFGTGFRGGRRQKEPAMVRAGNFAATQEVASS